MICRASSAVVVDVVVAAMTHRFWGVSLPAGGSSTQKLERGSTLVLTAVGVSGGASAERTVLRAESSGCDAVLCSLWSACTSARFAQPFTDDVTFRSTGGAELHLSGFARGALSEPEASGKKAKAKKPAAVADLVGLAPPSVEAARGKISRGKLGMAEDAYAALAARRQHLMRHIRAGKQHEGPCARLHVRVLATVTMDAQRTSVSCGAPVCWGQVEQQRDRTTQWALGGAISIINVPSIVSASAIMQEL